EAAAAVGALARAAARDDLSAQLAALVGEQAGLDGVVVARAQRAGAELQALATWQSGKAVEAPVRSAPSGGEDLLSRALRAGHAQSGGARTALPRRWRDALRLSPEGAAVAVPARAASGPYLLVLASGDEGAAHRAAALLQTLAPAAALALAALELREHSIRREQRLTTLNEVLL